MTVRRQSHLQADQREKKSAFVAIATSYCGEIAETLLNTSLEIECGDFADTLKFAVSKLVAAETTE